MTYMPKCYKSFFQIVKLSKLPVGYRYVAGMYFDQLNVTFRLGSADFMICDRSYSFINLCKTLLITSYTLMQNCNRTRNITVHRPLV